MSKNKNQSFDLGKCVAILSACIIYGLLIYFLFVPHRGQEDPHWYETHAEASSILEAERIFGKNFMFDKLLLSKIENPYNFSSTLEWKEGGSLEDKSSWDNLDIYIDYPGKSQSLIYQISLRIFFNHNNDFYADDYKTIFDGKEKTLVINGVEITYIENKDQGEYPYVLMAKFNRYDYIYYFSSSSKESYKLSWKVLEQYLSE